jgi:hypothetical protein
MLTRLRDQIGTAGLVVAIVALVAALGGGAYAASKGLNSTQKKEVKKIAKSFQGTGPQGAAGPAGAPGPAGPKGDTGAAGTNGTNGVSVNSAAASVAECPNGGTKFTSASGTSKACNGEDGEPWVPNTTLPEGATLTGIWGTYTNPTPEGAQTFPISFPIPLANPPKMVFVNPGEDKTALGCPGVSGADITATPPRSGIPQADPGKLCIYADQMSNAVREGVYFSINGEPGFIEGAGELGTILNIKCEAGCAASGTWAVTAE